MSQTQYLFSGFGGQGILFAGKFLAYKGLMEERQVSWLPSYGPEMRGGTASCSVILSDEAVGSPIVTRPDVLVAMNLPSLDKFEDSVAPGGIILVDSTLVERKVSRTDVTAYYIPATKMAGDNGLGNLANMIIVGKLLAVTGQYDPDSITGTLSKVVSARKANLLDTNRTALKLGADFE